MKSTENQRSNFHNYQCNKVANRVAIIEAYLRVLRKSKAVVSNVTDLASMVAAQISIVQEKSCATSTLLRNPHYKKLLTAYLVELDLRRSSRIGCAEVDSGHTRSLQSTLQLSNLLSETSRLKRYIAELESSREKNPLQTLKTSTDNLDIERKFRALEIAHAQTLQAVHAILTYWSEYMKAELSVDEIVDRAFSRGDTRRIIVGPRLASHYCDWARKNALKNTQT